MSNGLLEFDQWLMSANQDGNGNNILLQNNLARPTGKLQGGYKGSGMSVSSGIWTFPSTGYWLVRVVATFEVNDDFAAEVCIEATDDNSSYDRIARCDAGTRANIGRLHTSSCVVIMLSVISTSVIIDLNGSAKLSSPPELVSFSSSPSFPSVYILNDVSFITSFVIGKSSP